MQPADTRMTFCIWNSIIKSCFVSPALAMIAANRSTTDSQDMASSRKVEISVVGDRRAVAWANWPAESGNAQRTCLVAFRSPRTLVWTWDGQWTHVLGMSYPTHSRQTCKLDCSRSCCVLDAQSFKSVHSQEKRITNSEALKSSMTISSYFPKRFL